MPDSTNVRRISIWLLSAALAALYVGGAGFAKVTGAEEMAQNFRDWGYPDAFRIFIGLCEIAGGLGLLIPRLATWAAAGLVCVMAGAVYTHLSQGAPGAWIPAILLIVLLGIAYLRRDHALFLHGPAELSPETPDRT